MLRPKHVLGLTNAYCLAYSADGVSLASGHQEGIIRVWNTKTWEIQQTLQGSVDDLNCLAFSPDSQHLISSSHPHDSRIRSGSYDKSILVWNTNTWKIQQKLQANTDLVTCVAYSPDGKLVASGSRNGKILVWNTKTWQNERTLQGHTESVICVAFPPDGQRLESASKNGTTMVWNTETWKIQQTHLGYNNDQTYQDDFELNSYYSIYFLEYGALSPNGHYLVGARNKCVDIWRTEPSTFLFFWNTEIWTLRWKFQNHTADVRCVAFSPDGQHLVSGADDKNILVWNTETWRIQQRLEDHTGNVICVAFSPDGRYLVSGSSDKRILVWNTETWKIHQTMENHTDEVRSGTTS